MTLHRAGVEEPIDQVVTSAADGGRFSFAVPGGVYRVTAQAPFYAPASFGPSRCCRGPRSTSGR